MVGGRKNISECFIDPDKSLQLKLRPEDPYAHPVDSAKVVSQENVLLKIRVPRKIMARHRGDVRAALAECEERGEKYRVTPAGMLGQTYRFRALADFQMLPSPGSFTRKFDASVVRGDLSGIQDLARQMKEDYNQRPEFVNTDMDIPPLVRFARADVPYTYRYTGNLLLDKSGQWQDKAVKLHTIFVGWGEPVPRTFDPVLQEEYDKAVRDYEELKRTVPAGGAEESPVFYFLECIKLLRKLFAMKPVWLRRHIHWMLPEKFRTQLRYALPYVAYTTTKGPWRQSFIRFGYDPAKDPEAAKFQVEAFRSNRNHVTDAEVKRMLVSKEDVYIIPQTLYGYLDEFSDPKSELNRLQIGKVPRQFFFDGENPTTVVSYQVGDIMDEDVKRILKEAKIEPNCHEGSGWYDWVTICRLRAVVKYKLGCINEGKAVSESRVVGLSQRTQFSKNQYVHIRSDSEKSASEGSGKEDENADNNAEDEEEEAEGGVSKKDGAEPDIIGRLKKFNPDSGDILKELKGLVKQEDVMKVEWTPRG